MSQGEMGSMAAQQAHVESLDHVIKMLWEAYVAENPDNETVQGYAFAKFARDYLDQNRPVRTFAADENAGIVLSNGVQVLLSPRTSVARGTMQQSPLGNSQVPDVWANQGAVPISGRNTPPAGVIDKTRSKPASDQTQPGSSDTL